MSTHDMNIANQGFPAFRSDLNNALAALVSNSSSATEPTTTFAYQFWADTGNDLLKQRNAANDGWVSILTLSTGAPVNVTNDAITEGNSSLSVIDTGTGYISLVLDGVEVGKLSNNSGVATALILDPRANGASIWGGSNAIYPGNQSSQSDGLLALGSSTNRFKELHLSGGVQNLGGASRTVPIYGTDSSSSTRGILVGDNKVRPNTDGTEDLGASGNRFKDLYLSGGVYLGGTGSANHLDDYEEGTWTPTSNIGSITFTSATYTKIGRNVTVNLRNGSLSNVTDGSNIAIGGLPFTPSSQTTYMGSCMIGRKDTNNGASVFVTSAGFATFFENNTGNLSGLPYSGLNSTSNEIYFTVTYQV